MSLHSDPGDQCPRCGEYTALVRYNTNPPNFVCRGCGKSGFVGQEQPAPDARPNGHARDTLKDILASADEPPKQEEPPRAKPQGHARLEPDAKQLHDFIETMFKHATKGTFVSPRAFEEGRKDNPPFQIAAVEVGTTLELIIKRSIEIAGVCAQAVPRVVFSPPIATFKSRKKATETDLAEGSFRPNATSVA